MIEREFSIAIKNALIIFISIFLSLALIILTIAYLDPIFKERRIRKQVSSIVECANFMKNNGLSIDICLDKESISWSGK